MKYSQYNSLIPISEENTILYNATSDKFMILTHTALQEYNKGANHVADNNPSLFAQLKEVHAIVDDHLYEVKEIRQIVRNAIEDESTFELHVTPTLDCNFNCWYCYENHVKGSQMDEQKMASVKNFIAHTLREKKGLKHFHLSFFGGEPLLYFKRVAFPLIAFAKEQCESRGTHFTSHFTTNGYLLNTQILDSLEGLDMTFQITLDGDPAHHNQTRHLSDGTGSYERICKNIHALAERKHTVILRINYTLANLSGIHYILDTFATISKEIKAYIRVDLQRVWQDSDQKDDDNVLEKEMPRLIKLFHDSGFHVTYHRIYNSARFPCYGDKRNSLLINYDGKVFSCTARNFTSERSEGQILADGSIQWNGNRKEQRIASKFNRAKCHQCRIAPICGGGCTQHALETPNESQCPQGLDDKGIQKMILDRFEFMFLTERC